ncbi:MAG: MFS transporter [Parvularculales bacterium]
MTTNTAADAAEVFTPKYRRNVLLLLTAVYTVNFVDRQILSILLEPVKHALELSDTQLGFLSGIAFAIFYATLGIPIAMLADRYNRRRIITLSLSLFSLMTAVCGFVTNFWQLAVARIGVGIGEAGTSPPSHSIISDLYPREERASALAFFSLGVNAGILIGFLVGGWVNVYFGWRITFLTVGLPGLLLAIFVRYWLREPPRGYADGHTKTVETPPIKEVLRYLWGRRAFIHIALATALSSFIGYGAIAWLPSFLARSHGLDTGQSGTALALIIGIAGGCGTYMGGVLADKLSKRDVRWNMWLPVLAALIGVPFSVAFYLVDDTVFALILYAISAVVSLFYLGPSFAMCQAIAEPRMRAVTAALLLFILNIIGLGLGPQTVGILSDLLETGFGQDSLRYSLLIVNIFGLWAMVHFMCAARHLKDNLDRVGER